MNLEGEAGRRFCEGPDLGVRAVLLYGSDRGLVSELGRVLIGNWMGGEVDSLCLTRLFAEDLSEFLFDSLEAVSLFGASDPVVHVRLENERHARVLIEALESYGSRKLKIGGYWLVEAGDLGMGSRLLRAFSREKRALSICLSEDISEEVLELLDAAFSGVAEISEEAREFCGEALAGNRALALSEIEKLCLYGQGLGREVSLLEAQDLLLSGQEKEVGGAVDLAFSGDLKGSLNLLERYFEGGGGGISGLRGLHIRLRRLLFSHIGGRLFPPVLSGEREKFDSARSYWVSGRLVRALDLVRVAELCCKRVSGSERAILERMLLDLSLRRL